MVPRMALIRENGSLNITFYVRDPKRHIFGPNRMFWCILRQNPSRSLGTKRVANPPPKKKLTRFWCAKSRMRGDETPGRIVTNFCTGVGVRDVITCADLYYDRLRCMGVAGVKYWLSPLTCFVALTTLSHYRASV